MTPLARLLVFTIVAGICSEARADWPQYGGSPARNNVSPAKNLPVEWNVGHVERESRRWDKTEAKNVLWLAPLGDQTYGTPVVAGGKVYCCTSNPGYVKRYPKTVDLGCLVCLRQSDGALLWQLSREKHPLGKNVDWPEQGMCSTPLVEGDRLWVVTNRGEVMCLDTEGFRDGKNDGPYRDEPSESRDEADIIWSFDAIERLGVVPHNMSSCSVTAAGDLLLVVTANGVDESHKRLAAPDAPAFIALDKRTGELLWSDKSPSPNILHGQWSSPAFAVLGGKPQAIFSGGDGWLYSFLAEKSASGRPELLWKFDANPKTAVWKDNGRGNRNEIVATPIVAGGSVYVGTGQDPDHGEGNGILWCVDPTKRGDVSAELVVDRAGKPVPARRVTAVDPSAGETVKANPNSAEVWRYAGHDANGDGKFDFEETMHRTLSMAVVAGDLLVTADLVGTVHCLDAKTGRVHWTHDMLAAVWGSPLVADGKIYLGDEDGDVTVFALSPKKQLLAENNVAAAVYSTPAADGDVLYIATRTFLVALKRSTVDAAGR